MATITRDKIIRGDLANYDGLTKTASRVDATGGTVTGLTIGESVDVLQVYGSGTERTVTTITDAVNRIGTANVSLLFASGTWTIDSDVTIPSNLTSIIPAGCILNVSSGKTVTFNGPVISDRPDSEFSAGSGSVTLAADSIVNGQYWRARTQAEIDAGVTPSNTQYSGDVNDYDVRRLGLSTSATAADNTTALNNAWSVVSGAGGGTIRVEPGDYDTVSVNWSDANTGWVEIVAYGVVFTRSSTTSPYTMLTHRKNTRICGLKLKGYIDSGTDFSTVVPTDGYGFRPDGTQAQNGDVEYVDCVAEGLSYDGFYIDAASCRAHLVGCDGHDNVRNDLAFVNGQSLTLKGGEWGNDAQVLTKNACIDIEPDPGKSVEFASVKNVRAFHKVAFYGAAAAGLIEVGEIDDIVFDGDVYGSTCGLRWYRVDEMRIGRYEEINSATLQQAGDPESADSQGQGGFRFLNPTPINVRPQTKNLVVSPYNSTAGWTASIGGGTTATPNVDCYGFKGIRLDNAATTSINYNQDVTISLAADTWFTFGGLIRLVDAIGGNRQGIRITFGGDSYYLAGDGYVAAAIKVPSATTTINFYIGTADALNFDMVFTKLFLCEGLCHPFAEFVEPIVVSNGAPTAGTWAKGDIVHEFEPDAGDPSAYQCTSAGSPGTWWPKDQVGYRTNAGSPSGALTPKFIGERVFDTTNEDWYTATGTGNTDWKQDSA